MMPPRELLKKIDKWCRSRMLRSRLQAPQSAAGRSLENKGKCCAGMPTIQRKSWRSQQIEKYDGSTQVSRSANFRICC